MNLKHLGKIELDQRIRTLHAKENNLLQDILWTIKEVDGRRLYLEFGYANLFLYLTQGIGYSEGSAQRRIDGARLLHEIPEAIQLIQSGEINLSQISMVQKTSRRILKTQNRKITNEQKKALLSQLSNKNHSETQFTVSNFFQIPVLQDFKKTMQADESVRLEITLSKELFEKIEQAQQLLSHSIPSGDLVKYLEFISEKVIQAKTCVKPLVNLIKAEAEDVRVCSNVDVDANKDVCVDSGVDFSLDANQSTDDHLVVDSTRSTHRQMAVANARPQVSAKVRRQILKTSSCCQYKDPVTGKTCQSNWFLQIDHRQPLWAGGTHTPENLQILCGAHNRMKYTTEAGIKLVAK